jgi:hypothetical protein
VEGILLTLIEPGRAPTVRGNRSGEALDTAVAELSNRFDLNWTGLQQAGRKQLPDGSTLIFVTLDPTAPLWIYDYNNRGAAGAAQSSIYNWQNIELSGQASSIGGFFGCDPFTVTRVRPYGAVPDPSSQWQPHDGFLSSRHSKGGDKFYMLINAPPGNTDAANSQVHVVVGLGAGSTNPNVIANDWIVVELWDANDDEEFLASKFIYQVTAADIIAAAVVFAFIVGRTSFYGLAVAYNPVEANTTPAELVFSVAQLETCAMMTVHQLPSYEAFNQIVSRIRVLGSALDIINQINKASRGGSILVSQLGSDVPMLNCLQLGLDPVTWLGSTRRVEPRDFAEGAYGFVKPQSDQYLTFKHPYLLRVGPAGNGGSSFIEGSRSPILLPDGYVAFAITAKDTTTGVGDQTLTITTRGQVTLDYRAAVEFDSEVDWFAFRRTDATDLEWELALEALIDLNQWCGRVVVWFRHSHPHWYDDPDWGKIWEIIKKGAHVGAKIAALIPHPYAQGIARGTETVLNVVEGMDRPYVNRTPSARPIGFGL